MRIRVGGLRHINVTFSSLSFTLTWILCLICSVELQYVELAIMLFLSDVELPPHSFADGRHRYAGVG
jgi:hypothetical protein